MLWLLFYQDETTARYLSFSKLVERLPALDLNFDGNTVAWLQKYYRTRGTSAAELEGTGTLFHTQPFLRHYQELRDLARQLGRWETLRPEVLAFLEQAQNTPLLIKTALDDGDIDRALEPLGRTAMATPTRMAPAITDTATSPSSSPGQPKGRDRVRQESCTGSMPND